MEGLGEKSKGRGGSEEREGVGPERWLLFHLSKQFQFNAYPRNLFSLEAPSRGHLICFPAFRDKTLCVCVCVIIKVHSR